ncbi:hypothetical protein QBC47DRAFT_198026 [Echria macrotheca]|uniref:Uncharacterized protein n=1 Tax=Echria macrotheca TaxID=438768 RepID=A0AAJ0BEK1_9PEZI|nr:hypothetical protein QBC47DRAFT_198026 [Echria macrotheca]
MVRQGSILLALAGLAPPLATAILDKYVTVNYIEDILLAGPVNVKVVNKVVVAADVSDPEISACVTADAVLSSCVASGLLETTAPTASAKDCLCCYGGHEIVSDYSSCATYIAKSYPTETAAFSTVSVLYAICATGTCPYGGAAATPTLPPAASRASTTSAPAGCTSFVSIFNSCSDKLDGFSTLPLSDLASCFCYDKSGNYNTRFDNYASSCAPFAKTADPQDYSVISALGTFCEDYPPITDKSFKPSATLGGIGGGGIGGLGGGGASLSAPTSSSASATVTVTIKSSSALAPPGAAVPGFVAWAANLLTFVASFFILL